MTNENKFFDTSTLDHDLLVKITQAQLKHTSELMSNDHWLYSDDAFDDITSATRLSSDLLDMLEQSLLDSREIDETRPPGIVTAAKLLDTGLWEYACDGVCQFLYDLKPKSLDDDYDPDSVKL
jgi:hypothetical protein